MYLMKSALTQLQGKVAEGHILLLQGMHTHTANSVDTLDSLL